jgi:hypothetical protein
MNDTEGLNQTEQKIQSVLNGYLQRHAAGSSDVSGSEHLDEDVLTAFVEGSLGENASKPLVAHLVDCSFCRHVSAELIKLDLAFAEEAPAARTPEAAPAGVGEVLSGILSRIFGSGDAAVFAHEEKDEDETETEDQDKKDG